MVERMNAGDAKLRGRLDLSRVGMSGHSYGAVTTMALSGQSLAGGPYAWQLHADGKFSLLAGAARRERSTGNWRVDDRSRYCRTLNEPRSREFCFAVVANQGRLQFFDADGLMRFDTVAE